MKPWWKGATTCLCLELDMFPKSTKNLFVPKVLKCSWMIIEKRRTNRLHLGLDTKATRWEPRSMCSGRLRCSTSTEEIKVNSQMRHNYSNKSTVPIRVNLAVGRPVTLQVTEDWTCEDLYAAVAEQTPDMSFELITGFPPKKIDCSSDKVLKRGFGNSVIRQVKHCPVCWNKCLRIVFERNVNRWFGLNTLK